MFQARIQSEKPPYLHEMFTHSCRIRLVAMDVDVEDVRYGSKNSTHLRGAHY